MILDDLSCLGTCWRTRPTSPPSTTTGNSLSISGIRHFKMLQNSRTNVDKFRHRSYDLREQDFGKTSLAEKVAPTLHDTSLGFFSCHFAKKGSKIKRWVSLNKNRVRFIPAERLMENVFFDTQKSRVADIFVQKLSIFRYMKKSLNTILKSF